MMFTVALCTWNGNATLSHTLARLAKLDAGDFGWELVVVDNASTDATPAVLSRAPVALPLRVEHEPRLGLSHARNHAVRAARGRWIVWLDDDVLVDPGWLRAYQRAVERWREAAFLGGPISPRFEGEVPEWLIANDSQLAGVYGTRDLGPREFEFDRSRLPFGGNMAVRSDIARRVPFDPELGLAGSDRLVGEETDHLHRLVDLGCRGWWVPEARVEHVIGAEQLTLSHVRRFFEGLGRAVGLKRGPGLPASWFAALAYERRFRAAVASGAASEDWIPLLIDASLARGRCIAQHGRGEAHGPPPG